MVLYWKVIAHTISSNPKPFVPIARFLLSDEMFYFFILYVTRIVYINSRGCTKLFVPTVPGNQTLLTIPLEHYKSIQVLPIRHLRSIIVCIKMD